MKITVYTTPTCPYCKLVKDFLREKEADFTEVDVSLDHSAATQMVKLSGQMGVPVIDLDGRIIVGWNKAALEEALSPKRKASMAMEKKHHAAAA